MPANVVSAPITAIRTSVKRPLSSLTRWSKKAMLAAALSLSAAGTAMAHPMWLLPHEFNLSGEEPEWITVDASASHTIFGYDKALGLDRAEIIAPDGSKQRVSSYFKGHRRSVFDLQIDQPGTWKLSAQRPPVYITYYVSGKRDAEKRMFVDKQEAKNRLPANAREINTMVYQISTMSFITWQAPDNKVLKLKNKGLELAGSTHPSDVVAGEEVEFQVFMNGKPAADVSIELTPHGTKYRDDRQMIEMKSDKDGMVVFTPEIAGPWFMSAYVEKDQITDRADKVGHLLYMTFETQLP